MFYILTMVISMALIIVLNMIFYAPRYNLNFLYVLIAVIISTIVEILISGVIATLIRKFLPEKWFGVDKTYLMASKREQKIYEKLKIKVWKDKILELGCFTGFNKNKIKEPNSVEYVERFIIEANYGEVIHFISCFLGFLVIFIYPLKYWYMFGLPVAIVGLILNLMPTLSLRYNLSKLHVLYKFNLKRKLKKD